MRSWIQFGGALLTCGSALLVGCGGDSTTTTTTTGGGTPAEPGPWTSVAEASWSLAPGSESYRCARVTIPEEMYVQSFRAIAPVGTHHTVVTLEDGSKPDAEFDCSPGTLSDRMVYSSGVGTDDMVLPPGVAVKLPAGQQILLNLHLFNSSTDTIEGTSGTEVRTIDPASVEHEAEMVFAGSFFINLPPQSESEVVGTCPFDQDATVLSVWPHMHQLGTHMRVLHASGGTETVLHDAAFSFEEQTNFPIDPIVVAKGDSITVECTYDNTTTETVSFGDSSNSEMCFAGLYRYPTSGEVFCNQPF